MNNKYSKIIDFMRGRYGIDELHRFLFYVYFVLVVIDFFVNFYPLTIIEFVLIIYIFYRILSRNIKRRRKENDFYLRIKNKITKIFINNKHNKNKIYKKCSKCKTNLRLDLPYKRGIKHVICPKCHKRLTVFCLRKQKIEVITNKKKK